MRGRAIEDIAFFQCDRVVNGDKIGGQKEHKGRENQKPRYHDNLGYMCCIR